MAQENEEMTWNCWTLSEEEIYVVAAEHDVSRERIEENVEMVAHYFKKAVESILGSWDKILWESIEEVLGVIKEDEEDAKWRFIIQ